jgi:hypothetical protein
VPRFDQGILTRIRPQLPTPVEGSKQLERKDQQRIEAERQPSLFSAQDTATDTRDTQN